MKKLIIGFIAIYLAGVAYAASLTVSEVDGSPKVLNVRGIKVTNGTLTNNNNGQVTITTGGGGGGGALDDLSDVVRANTSSYFLGYNGGIAVTTGARNTTLGYDAGKSITSALDATAIGYQAMNGTTISGGQSTGIGSQALKFNTTGTNNTAVGRRAGYYNTTGSDNTALGAQACQGSSGNAHSNNTCIGSAAGSSLTTGASNVILGYNAGTTITSGASNIVIGPSANVVTGSASNQLNIGDTVYGDTANKKIGINTSSPGTTLHVHGVLSARAGTSSDTVRTGGVMYVSTAAVTNIGAGEDDLGSYSIPANTLSTNGDSIWFEACGAYASTGNSKQVRVRFGSTGTTLIMEAPLDGGAVGKNWSVRGRIYRTSSAAQHGTADYIDAEASSGVVFTARGNPTQTLSGAVSLRITGEATDNGDVSISSFVVGWDPNNT